MMTQEFFDSIAEGKLPLVAGMLSQHRAITDDGTSPAAHPAPSADGGAVHAQWGALLARLAYTAQRCAQPDVMQQLRGFGVRRTKTVVISLAHEYGRALELAASCGMHVSIDDVLLRSQHVAPHERLDDEFHALAEAYRRLAWVMALRDGSPLSRWLNARAYVHGAQAQAIRRGMPA